VSKADRRAELTQRLSAIPSRLADAAGGASGPIPDGEWSPADVVRHLIAVEEEVWHVRLRQLETEDRPNWPWAEPDRWQGAPNATLKELLQAYHERRNATIEMLDRLGDEGWRKEGVHATFGVLDVAALMTKAIDHDEEHLASFGPTSPGEAGPGYADPAYADAPE
jgi:hypothetical protein